MKDKLDRLFIGIILVILGVLYLFLSDCSFNFDSLYAFCHMGLLSGIFIGIGIGFVVLALYRRV